MHSGCELPSRADSEGVALAVRLTPRASRNGVDGIFVGAEGRPALGLRLIAPPVDGAANAALIAFLAKALDLRKQDIVIRSGATARLKIVHLAGEPASIEARLAAWLKLDAPGGA